MTRHRIGQGFDVHRFGGVRNLVLCGVELAETPGLVGHSDADVALHALCDALLGSVAAGDLGEHYPSTDDRWRDVESKILLRDVLGRVAAAGCRILNCDLTIIGEHPRIAPHRRAFRRRLAELLEIDEATVSIKATTTEGLGFVGRGEGLAAMAVVLVEEVGSDG